MALLIIWVNLQVTGSRIGLRRKENIILGGDAVETGTESLHEKVTHPVSIHCPGGVSNEEDHRDPKEKSGG